MFENTFCKYLYSHKRSIHRETVSCTNIYIVIKPRLTLIPFHEAELTVTVIAQNTKPSTCHQSLNKTYPLLKCASLVTWTIIHLKIRHMYTRTNYLLYHHHRLHKSSLSLGLFKEPFLFCLGQVIRLGGAVGSAPARRAEDQGWNPGPDKNFFS